MLEYEHYVHNNDEHNNVEFLYNTFSSGVKIK